MVAQGLSPEWAEQIKTFGPIYANLQRRMRSVRGSSSFSLDSASLRVIGPTQPAEEYLDVEAARLRIAKEINHRVWQGHEAIVKGLSKLPSRSPVAYVVWQNGNQRAKCYFNLTNWEVIGVMVSEGAEEASMKPSPAATRKNMRKTRSKMKSS